MTTVMQAMFIDFLCITQRFIGEIKITLHYILEEGGLLLLLLLLLLIIMIIIVIIIYSGNSPPVWNPRTLYRVHSSPPLGPNPSHMKPVISFIFSFSNEYFVCMYSLPCVVYALRISCYSFHLVTQKRPDRLCGPPKPPGQSVPPFLPGNEAAGACW